MRNLGNAERFLISDSFDQKVQLYDLKLDVRGPTTPGALSGPGKVEVMTNDHVAVTSIGCARVHLFDLRTRNFIHSLLLKGSPRGVFQIGTSSLPAPTARGPYRCSTSGSLERAVRVEVGFQHFSPCRSDDS